ncbi:MAG: hypothetical protein DRI61_04360 [Chloroflexi bacterium]|nr:MAG: hypothetical protein DRI61_04360 [Chloroflexota bacterium]
MLRDLLRLIGQEGIHNPLELAKRLEVSQALLEQMLEDLARMGYLKPAASQCPGQCVSCPLLNRCAVGGQTRVWMLTEKGMEAVKKGHRGESPLLRC